ncbi:MAG: GNAT family N-acetyltransferase [Solirubrobacterales bacterium]
MDFVIRRGRADEIDRLAPLWRALRDHHATLPAMPPVRSHEDSWEHRRGQYLDWLSEDGYTLLVAERNGQLIGYAMVSVDEGAATWDVGERAAEIETLSVLESERGRGVGRALTEAAAEVATEAGASAVAVGVAHTNADAIRFYEREGFEPFYVLMLSERPRSTRSTVRSGSDGRSRPAAAPGSGVEP